MQNLKKTKTEKPVSSERIIYLSQIEKTKKTNNFPDNTITTSKYNAFSFLPYAIAIQFKRYANIYFLVTAIIQCIPIISPLNPATAIIPFVVVLAISVFREGLEDWNRHKQDNIENGRQFLRYNYNSQKYEKVESYKLEVGDVIQLTENAIIPADSLL